MSVNEISDTLESIDLIDTSSSSSSSSGVDLFLPDKLAAKYISTLKNEVYSSRPKMEGQNIDNCRKLLKVLAQQKDYQFFIEPITPEYVKRWNIPNYFNIVQKPMDFTTVNKNLESGNFNFLSS